VTVSTQASEFAGTARYKVLRRLGAGNFGVVYEAEDLILGGSVALKVLHTPSGSALYRFKNEFRALADLKHENLVALRELTSERGRWFFTMELVQGVDLVKYIWGDHEALMRDPSSTGSGPRKVGVGASSTAFQLPQLGDDLGLLNVEPGPPSVRAPIPFDIGRLRDTFAQLARGMSALHDAEKIHRDIKPSNILVEPDGRLVLLDFGLVASMTDASMTAETIVGTPAYMAPEQALAENVGPACDWYSVGCLLYLTLTGRLPVLGDSAIAILTRKQVEDPPRPSELRLEVPADLDELCMALLDRHPSKRPAASEIIERLGARPRPSVLPRSNVHTSPFVGRAEELAKLSEAYRTMRDGRTVVVTVRGRSGFGKTSLVRDFIQRVERADPGLVALTGRCYERESVPYKALDAIVDGLRRYLRRIPELELSSLLPRNLGALTRLFPVFKGVVDAQPRRPESLRDTLEIRRRGFSALHEMLARLADRQRVIVFIDDLQWGDFDSAAGLAEILAPPDPPSLLLVLGYRSEDVKSNKLLEVLSNLARGTHLERVDIELGPLGEGESRELVTQLVRDAAPRSVTPRQIEQIVREGAGMPFMLGELVAFMQQVGDASERASALASSSPTSLVDALVRARAALLDDDARALLEVICVAGQPLSCVSAYRAAHLDGDRAQASLDALRAAKLVRTIGTSSAEQLETLHDRVGEAITAGVAADGLAARHDALAEALGKEPDCDPERLGMHLRAAGHEDRAREYIERAASHASATLAFERAVRLYRAALDLSGGAQELRAKLADALANAGYGGEAGRAFLDAIPGAAPGEANDLRRRAAEQFLRSGHIDEALPVVEEVLAEVGLKIPSTPKLSLASLLVQRGKLWFRGLDFEERATVPAEELRKIDVCWALGNGMGGVDVVRGADFQARHLLLALEAGEPYRISRALAWEAILSSIEGGSSGFARAAKIAPRAMSIAKRLDNPHALAWATAAEAIRHFSLASWKAARTNSEAAIALFQEHCADIGWEVGSMEMWWWLPSTRWLGDYSVLCRRAQACAREASERGDLYTSVGVRTHCVPHVHLIGDRPEEASHVAGEAIKEWSQRRWLTHHRANALAQAHAALYSMRLGAALEGLERDIAQMQSALQLRLKSMRIQAIELRSRVHAAAALAEGKETPRRRELLGKAEHDAMLLDKEHLPWPTAIAKATRAAISKARGDREEAAAAYGRASAAFEELDMAVHALAAQLHVANLTGGDEGKASSADICARLRERGVVSPERLAAMLVP
jgi:serine/threonine protein kinase